MSANCFYVYLHRRRVSGLVFYVGKGHGARAYSHKSRNAHWKSIVAKDDGHIVDIAADGLDEELAFFAETELIDQMRRIGVKLANLTEGGDGPKGRVFSEESKLKMRAKRMSTESREKMRAAKIGRPLSDVHKQKLSESLKKSEFVRTRPDMSGFTHSEESRAKMSDAKLGMKAHNRKPVRCVESGAIFESAKAAAQNFGRKEHTLIAACCTGSVRTAYGHKFEYVNV